MYDVSLYVCVFVCLFAVVKIRVYVLIGSTRGPLSLFSVLECDVYVQLKKKKEMKLKNIYQQHK